jgi:hypothetical protein
MLGCVTMNLRNDAWQKQHRKNQAGQSSIASGSSLAENDLMPAFSIDVMPAHSSQDLAFTLSA